MSIEVELETVISPIESGEKVPLVPSDPGHLLEEWENIDPYGGTLLAASDPTLESPPSSGQRSRKVAEEV